ncbi:argininosuccinate synthase-related protein [Streptomyces sp. NBC_01022]|uniref:argininosuccinate synthase-related protein n=1 Tax=Streptomyces sp. NBC_01022 TaxID=2903723 RepID=UPI002DDBD3A4|nr:argininosuccinate synthase-related protein [Streptomyces sp. NBC_01022]WRZ85024.1 argininosuccinate synthase-related protein [Streptomyces sp. NBC_01022]
MKSSRRIIRSFRDVTEGEIDLRRPIVTLFSGGLDSSYLLYRLVQAGATDVHAISVGLDGDEETSQLQRIADKLGVHLQISDARASFVEEFVRPAIAAGSVYLDTHPVSSSLSRPLIARIALSAAREVDASVILHTANRSQNTLRRLNGAFRLLGFEGHYGSPYELDPVAREVKIKELGFAGLDEMAERSASGDSNLWCREFESGVLDDPEEHSVPESYYRWSALPDAQVAPEEVEVTFRAGVPVALNGRELPLLEIIQRLNPIIGAHGLGRYTGLEHLPGGVKVLEVREMPAAWLLLASRRHLETAVLDAETIREKMHIEQVWVREALEGRWFGELRSACEAFVLGLAAPLNGTVRWRLFGGRTSTIAIVADAPLYVRNREDWEESSIRQELAHSDGGNGQW